MSAWRYDAISTVKPVRWEFVVDCPKTGRSFGVGEATLPSDQPPPNPARVTAHCPHCGAIHSLVPMLIPKTEPEQGH